MAQTNYTPIQLYYSTTAAAVPVNTNLLNGELAINITDGKLYYKDNSGTVQVIATKGAGTIGGSTTQIQYNNAGALAGSSAMVFNNSTNVVTLTTLNLTNALGAIYGGTGQSTYTTGDLLYSSAANTLSKLAIGTANYILTVNSGGTNVQWSAPSAISVNTATNLAGGVAGSVPYQSGASTTTFLGIGAADRVMTSSGSAPQWVTALTGLTGVSSSSITNTSLTSGRVVYSGASGVQTDSASLTFNGTTLSAGGFSTTGLSTLVQTVKIGDSNFSGVAVFAPATPAKLYIGTGTVTDATSAIGATNATGAVASLAITPIAATNTSVTYTDAATLYIAGAPSVGTNISITNPYALYIAAGASYLGGNTAVTGTLSATGVATFSAGTAALPAITTTGDTNTGIFFPAADTIAFSEGGTEAMRLTSAGNLGIGSLVTYEAKLKVATANGASDFASSGINVCGATEITAGQVLPISFTPIGNDSTRARAAIGCIVGTNWGFGNLGFYTRGVADASLLTTSDEKMRLTSDGKLGIGTTSPVTNLSIGNGGGGNDLGVFLSRGATTNFYQAYDGTKTFIAGVDNTNDAIKIGALSNHPVVFVTNNSEKVRIDTSGRLGVGTTSPSNIAQFNTAALTNSFDGATISYNNTASSVGLYQTGTTYSYGAAGASDSWLYSSTRSIVVMADGASSVIKFASGGNTERARIDSSGNFGIGFTNPSAYSKLAVNGLIVSTPTYYNALSDANYATAGYWINNVSVPNDSASHWIPIAGGAAVTSGQGYVTQAIFGVKKTGAATFATGAYIGVTNNSDGGPGREFTFDTSGNFTAPGSKSFRIPHPLPEKSETHELWHVALEGPNLDLIYRGSVDLVGGKAEVNIDTVSRMSEGTFVALTKDAQSFTSNESDWTPVRGSVSGNILSIEAQDNTATSNVSWMVIAKRNDHNVIDEATTDDNGEFITERVAG